MKITVRKTLKTVEMLTTNEKLFSSLHTTVKTHLLMYKVASSAACRCDECSYGSNGRACTELMSTRSSALIRTAAASVANDASAAAAAAAVRCIGVAYNVNASPLNSVF